MNKKEKKAMIFKVEMRTISVVVPSKKKSVPLMFAAIELSVRWEANMLILRTMLKTSKCFTFANLGYKYLMDDH